MRKFIIVADDLTGSMDTSAYFARHGARSIVSLDADIIQLGDETVHAINAATRERTLFEARKVHAALGKRFRCSDRIVIKKTDMGFRGNHGAEIEGLLSGLGAQVCYLLNAIPDHRAFVRDAQQYVKGLLLPESMYAQDPSHKPTTASIPQILQKQTALTIGTISLACVRSGLLAGEICRCVEAGNQIIVFDAVTEDDCLTVVQESLKLSYPAIWAGTLGLMSAMARCCKQPDGSFDSRSVDVRRKCLCFTTSNYDTVRRQIACAAAYDLVEVTLDMDRCIYDTEQAQREIAHVCRCVQQANKSGNVILTQKLDGSYPDVCVSERILAVMAECAWQLVGTCGFDRLVVIGGETASAILRRLGITRLRITALPETGTALGSIDNGRLRGKSFAAKGGSVGTDEALLRLLQTPDAAL